MTPSRIESLLELARADALSNEEFNELADAFPALVERLAALEEDQPEVSSVGSPGLEVLKWRGKTYVESQRGFQ